MIEIFESIFDDAICNNNLESNVSTEIHNELGQLDAFEHNNEATLVEINYDIETNSNKA